MTLLLIYLAIAIGVSFLCSVLEAVLLSVTPSYLEQLTQERPKSGKAIQSVKDRLDESLSSILILNTFAHTMGCLLYTSPSPRDKRQSRMPSSA